MLKLENSIRGLSFSRVAFDLTIQDPKDAERRPFLLQPAVIKLIFSAKCCNHKIYA